MSALDLDNYSSPQSVGNKANLTLTELELAACKPVRAGGSSWRAFCPFHGSDHQRSLRLNVDNGHFNCFACGAWGYTETARKLWQEQQPKLKPSGPKSGSEKSLAARNNFSLKPAAATNPHLHLVSYKPPPAVVRQPAHDLSRLIEKYQAALPGSWGAEYLRRRKIPLELAQHYGIGYAPPGQWAHSARDWKFGRLVFPHTRPDGQLVNLYGRAVGSNDKVPKALRHDHLQGEKGYFNAGALGQWPESVRLDGQIGDIKSTEAVFICEGPFDALSLLASGQARVVAIFGVNGWRWEWTRSAKELVFALDTDETGQQSWRELARQARLRGKAVAFLPLEAYGGGKDINEAWVSGALESYFEKIAAVERESELIRAFLEAPHLVEVTRPVSRIEDPRPDLTGDSWLWEGLFRLSLEDSDRELYGSLHGLRCCGARLNINEDGLLRLGPGLELALCQFVELEQHYFQTNREGLESLLDTLSSKFKPSARVG